MEKVCDYCQGVSVDTAVKCASCGAPLSAEEQGPPNLRCCPHCKRRLLALASPACSYCGRWLPESYVKAREAILHRMSEIQGGEGDASKRTVEDLLRGSGRRGSLSRHAFIDIFDLTNLFNRR